MSEYIDADFAVVCDEWQSTVTSGEKQEYIKKEDVLGLIDKGYLISNSNYNKEIKLINELPTADVVEVVRCKDCKWFNLNKWAKVDGAPIIVGHEICDFLGGGCKTKEDGYCSYGERKDDEEVRD